MVAIVSSTIKPLVEKAVSFYSFEERLAQTLLTLVRLRDAGFDRVLLADNSPTLSQEELERLLQDFPDINVYYIPQYQFLNKGINELLMLLFLIRHIPPNQEIFKISGRYFPTRDFFKPAFTDFAFKAYDLNKKTGTVSTRGYWAKDAATLQGFLLRCLEEHFSYPTRVVGIKSMFRQVFSTNKMGNRVNISIEFAAANILKADNYKILLLDNIGIEGYVAGSNKVEKLIE